MAAEGRASVFVIFLDTYHTHHRRLGHHAAAADQFLDRVLGTG